MGVNATSVKGRLDLNAIFSPLDMALMEISRSHFRCDFWVYLGGYSFSRRIGKIKRNIEDLVKF